MARFSLPGRARAVRITTALALALALAAVFGSATASAAPSTTALTCGPSDEPVAGSFVTCKAVVTGGDSSRTLRFEQIGFTEFNPRTCTLLPLSKTSSFCVTRFKVLATGRLTVFATYLSATEEGFSSDSHEFLVKAGGSIRVECSPEFGFVGEISHCEVVVPNTPGVSEPPSGIVQFRSMSEFFGESAGPVDPECSLEPTPTGARCSLGFEPRFAGTAALIAEYEGDSSHPAQFGSVGYLIFEKHETKTSAKCDNPTPEKGIKMRCTVTVASLDETGGPPTGSVEFDEGDSENGRFEDAGTCRLQADEVEEEKANESSCSVIYKPSKVGPQVLEVQFLGSGRFDFGEPAFIELDVQPILRQHETKTSAKCDETVPVVKTTVTCTISVVNLDATGGPPAGRVDFNNAGISSGIFLGLKFCDLEAKDEFGSESSCTFRYEPLKLGSQVLTVQYRGDEHFKGGGPVSINLNVVAPRKTSTGVSCLANRGSFPGVCLVTVIDTSASPTTPSGTVKLNVPSTVKLNRETCDLTPIGTGFSATCAFNYTMTTIGSASVTAEYSGDAKGHEPSSGKGMASRQF